MENNVNPPYDPEGVNLEVRTLLGRRNMMIAAVTESPFPRLTNLILTTRVGNFLRNLITCKRLHRNWWKRSHRQTCFYWTRSH